MRTKKAIKNVISSTIYQIVAIICGLITPRLILSNFGSTYNGVVNSASQFISLISILTIGITGATRIAFYKTLANNDIIGTSRIMKATKKYMRKVASLLLLYVIILCFIYPYISHNDLTKVETIAIILIVSIGTFAQYFFGISNQTLLQADQSSYITYILDIVKTLLNTIIVYILILFGSNIFIVKFGSSIVFFVTPFIMDLYVKKKYNLINDCEPDKSGLNGRKDVAFLSIANMIHNNVDLFLLTLFTDAKLISVYTVYYLIVGKLKSVFAILTTGMEAAFGDMWVKKEYNNLKEKFNLYEFIIFNVVTIIFSCTAVLILDFIRLYTAGVNDTNYIKLELAILICIAEAFYCYRQPYLTIVQAAGKYKETKNGAAIEALLNFFVSIVMLFIFGLPGVIIGTLIANLFRTIQYAVFTSKYLIKRNIFSFFKRLFNSIFLTVLICLLSVLFTKNINCINWHIWLIKAFIVFLISFSITIFSSYIFHRTEVKKIYTIFIKAIRKKNKKMS